ncbi:MAG: hypothetical protein ACR2KQ_07300, partial [Actinomycetota bacterium]
MRTTNRPPSQNRPRSQIVNLGSLDPRSRPGGTTSSTEPVTAAASEGGHDTKGLDAAALTPERTATGTQDAAAPSGTDYSSFGNEALDRAGDQLHGIHNATLTELFSIGVEKERRGLLSQDGARDLAG